MDDTWFEDFFDGDYEQLFGPAIGPDETERAVNDLIALVGFQPGWRILDAPGGAGRHAIPLALLGARVTVVDRAPTMLSQARRAAARVGVDVRLVAADLRRRLVLPSPEDGHGPPFDLVANLFNSFGYFATVAEDAVMLDNLAAAVAPHGRLVMEVANRAALLAEPEHETADVDGVVVTAHRRWDPVSERLAITYRLEPEGGPARTTGTVQRLYPPARLAAMMAERGLDVERVAGDLDGRPLDDDQDYVVIVASRGP